MSRAVLSLTTGLEGGSYLVCPICFPTKQLAEQMLVENAALGGTVPMWQWIGDDPATTFSF